MTTENTTPPNEGTAPEPEPILGITLPSATAVTTPAATDKIALFGADGSDKSITPTNLLAGHATTEEMNTALATKAALVPHSLTEQIVLGEFWIGTNGVSRQVYQRTFIGTVPESSSLFYGPPAGILKYHFIVGSGLMSSPVLIAGGVGSRSPVHGYEAATRQWHFIGGGDGLIVLLGSATGLAGEKFNLTFRYNK